MGNDVLVVEIEEETEPKVEKKKSKKKSNKLMRKIRKLEILPFGKTEVVNMCS